MNNDVKPVIDPHTSDKYINDGNKNIKIAVVLTIVLLIVIGFISYSIKNKIGEAGHIDDSPVVTGESSTNTSVDPSNYIKQLDIVETDDLIIIEFMNTSNLTYDVKINVNLYANNELTNTYSKETIAVKSNSSTRCMIDKSDLGIYDRYEIKYGVVKSIYTSLISNDLLLDEDDALVDNKLYFDITNNTGKVVDKLTVIVLFIDKQNNIVDAKVSSVFGVSEKGNITVSDSTKDYYKKISYIVEAYTI